MSIRPHRTFAPILALLLGCGGTGSGTERDADHLTEAEGSCSSTSECSDAERCFEGRCVLELCDGATPCSEGGACIDGACCYSDVECGWCDSEDCLEPGDICSTSADCADDERCYDTSCVPVLCDDASPCAVDGVCLDGACCYPDESCAPCDSEDCG